MSKSSRPVDTDDSFGARGSDNDCSCKTREQLAAYSRRWLIKQVQLLHAVAKRKRRPHIFPYATEDLNYATSLWNSCSDNPEYSVPAQFRAALAKLNLGLLASSVQLVFIDFGTHGTSSTHASLLTLNLLDFTKGLRPITRLLNDTSALYQASTCQKL